MQWYIDKKVESYELKIIERWIYHYPKTLAILDPSDLLCLVQPQAKMEQKILKSKKAKEQLAQGITAMEILQEAQIDPLYYLIVRPPLSSPQFNDSIREEMQEEDWLEKEDIAMEIQYQVEQTISQMIDKVAQEVEEIHYNKSVEKIDKILDLVYLKKEDLDKKLIKNTENITSLKVLKEQIQEYENEMMEIVGEIR